MQTYVCLFEVVGYTIYMLFQVLDHATTGPEGAENCAKFVEILGLLLVTSFAAYVKHRRKIRESVTVSFRLANSVSLVHANARESEAKGYDAR